MYMEDLLIYSDTPKQHHKHVREVLCHLRQHNLFASMDKCEFSITTVEFLGSVLSPQGLQMSKDKVKVIVYWPIPQKIKDVQAFLSFVNFYQHFIYHYSNITIPLT